MGSVRATAAERSAVLPGDELLERADVVMDRAFSLPAPPAQVWPWFVQLGKNRAGWYLPRTAERLVPTPRRGLRRIEPRLQDLAVGTVIDDWGGRDATFTVARLDLPNALVHTSRRGTVSLTWATVLSPEPGGTRVQLRLRLHPVRRRWLAALGELVDVATVAGLASGLRERVGSSPERAQGPPSGP